MLLMTLCASCSETKQATGGSPASQDIDIKAVAQAIVESQPNAADYQLLEGEERDIRLSESYGLSDVGWTGAEIYTVAGADAREVAILELPLASDTETAAQKLEDYRQSRIGDFFGYLPEQAKLAEDGSVTTAGKWTALLMCEDMQAATGAFEETVGRESKLLPSPTPTSTLAPTPSPSPTPASSPASSAPSPTPEPSESTAVTPEVSQEPSPNPSNRAEVFPEPLESPETSARATATPKPSTSATATPKASASATATPKPSPKATATPKPSPKATPKPTPKATATPKPSPTPTRGPINPGLDTSSFPPFQPPNEHDMTLYDTSELLEAWKSGETGKLNDDDLELYLKCRRIFRQVIKDDMTDLEKEKALHDWIAKNCTYDKSVYDSETPDGLPGSLDPRGPILYGRAICLGYTTAFQLLMDMADVECITVCGAAYQSTEDHAWNMVRLDGEWYCVDMTWDDPNISSETDAVSYTYFNTTSEEMRKSNHQWDYKNVPEATATRHRLPATGTLPT